MNLIIFIIIILLLFGGGVGYYGNGAGWGYAGWSPLGVIVVLIILWLLLGRDGPL